MTDRNDFRLNRRQLLGSSVAVAAGVGAVAPRALLGAGAGLAAGGLPLGRDGGRERRVGQEQGRAAGNAHGLAVQDDGEAALHGLHGGVGPESLQIGLPKVSAAGCAGDRRG